MLLAEIFLSDNMRSHCLEKLLIHFEIKITRHNKKLRNCDEKVIIMNERQAREIERPKIRKRRWLPTAFRNSKLASTKGRMLYPETNQLVGLWRGHIACRTRKKRRKIKGMNRLAMFHVFRRFRESFVFLLFFKCTFNISLHRSLYLII